MTTQASGENVAGDQSAKDAFLHEILKDLVLNGRITINTSRMMLGLIPISGGDLKLHPPFSDNLADAIAEVGDRSQPIHSMAYDAVADIFTFDGFRFTGELLRMLTATPCGTTLRIIERKNGVITITQERDQIASAAPDMLAALRNVQKLISEAAMTGFNCKDGDWPDRLFASQQVTSAAVAKAESP